MSEKVEKISQIG